MSDQDQSAAMELQTLIQTVADYADAAEAESVLTTAFDIVNKSHAGFKRLDRKPYIFHPLAVAHMLADWRAPVHVVAGGLLHDVENPDYTESSSRETIHAVLGSDFLEFLEIVIALNAYFRHVEAGDFYSVADATAFRSRIATFLHKDQNAVVIKIADRLHNLQTASMLTQTSQERTVGIGQRLLAPLAERLGMGRIKRQIENLSFHISDPVFFRLLQQRITDAKIDQEAEGIVQELQSQLRTTFPGCSVYWQPNSLHVVRQNIRMGKSILSESTPLRLADLGSFIILLREENFCYQALGMMHKLYTPVRGQLRDYIADPPENRYQSLHTQVKHPSDHVLQLALRTPMMDLIAEYGIIASWWHVAAEMLPPLPAEASHLDGEMKIWTPKGEIKYLQQGATVLDFAYDIHTDIGHRCIEALVNGVRTELNAVLQDGDKVEVIQGELEKGPSLESFSYVKTQQAINRIGRWLAENRRSEMIEHGRTLLDRELLPLNLDSHHAEVQQWLSKLVSKQKLKGIEDLLVSIAVGRNNAEQLVKKFKDRRKLSAKTSEPGVEVDIPSPEAAQLPRIFASCCNPTTLDDIVGYCQTDGILAIHKRACSQIPERERLIHVKWGNPSASENYVMVIEAMYRPGLQQDIENTILNLGLNMQSSVYNRRADGITVEIHIRLSKTSLEQRRRLQKALEAIVSVSSVEAIHSSFLAPAPSPASPLQSSFLPNPFGPGIAEGTRFYGRETEFNHILSRLQNCTRSSAILLWGQKRIGKTSFVLRLKEHLAGKFFPVYIDMQAHKDGSTALFLHELMGEITKVFQEHIPAASQHITLPHLNRFRRDPLSYFDTFMTRIEEETTNFQIVVMLDEFQCLCSMKEEAVSAEAIFSRLRSRSLHRKGMPIILSGGGLPGQLSEQSGIATLFNIAYNMKLDCLEEAAARQLVKNGLSGIGGITQTASDFLLRLTAGHPFYLQLLCGRLFEQAQENKVLVNFDFAKQVINEWIEQTDSNRFQHLWEGKDSESAQRNRLVLSAMSQPGSHGVEFGQLSKQVCPVLSERKLAQSLDDLYTLGVIRRDHATYFIVVELFAQWLRYHMPLELVQKELHAV